MKINWYPGHMAKTKRLMQEDIRQIDLVCELLDARIPWASRNPDLSALAGQKKRIIVLNRAWTARTAAATGSFFPWCAR